MRVVLRAAVLELVAKLRSRVAHGGAAPPAAQAPLPLQALWAPRTGGAAGRQDPPR